MATKKELENQIKELKAENQQLRKERCNAAVLNSRVTEAESQAREATRTFVNVKATAAAIIQAALESRYNLPVRPDEQALKEASENARLLVHLHARLS